jgi:hypothetical protein
MYNLGSYAEKTYSWGVPGIGKLLPSSSSSSSSAGKKKKGAGKKKASSSSKYPKKSLKQENGQQFSLPAARQQQSSASSSVTPLSPLLSQPHAHSNARVAAAAVPPVVQMAPVTTRLQSFAEMDPAKQNSLCRARLWIECYRLDTSHAISLAPRALLIGILKAKLQHNSTSAIASVYLLPWEFKQLSEEEVSAKSPFQLASECYLRRFWRGGECIEDARFLALSAQPDFCKGLLLSPSLRSKTACNWDTLTRVDIYDFESLQDLTHVTAPYRLMSQEQQMQASSMRLRAELYRLNTSSMLIAKPKEELHVETLFRTPLTPAAAKNVDHHRVHAHWTAAH